MNSHKVAAFGNVSEKVGRLRVCQKRSYGWRIDVSETDSEEIDMSEVSASTMESSQEGNLRGECKGDNVKAIEI